MSIVFTGAYRIETVSVTTTINNNKHDKTYATGQMKVKEMTANIVK